MAGQKSPCTNGDSQFIDSSILNCLYLGTCLLRPLESKHNTLLIFSFIHQCRPYANANLHPVTNMKLNHMTRIDLYNPKGINIVSTNGIHISREGSSYFGRLVSDV